MKSVLFPAALVLTLSLSGIAGPVGAAGAPDPVQQHNSNAVWFENWIGLSNAEMVVKMPDGRIERIAAPSGTPVFELDRGAAPDGVYRFELRAATSETRKIVNPVDNGRGAAARDSQAVPFYLNGHFVVSRGVIITPEEIREDG